MARAFANLLAHVICSTQNQEAWITRTFRRSFFLWE